MKIINIAVSKCRILRLKCTKFNFGWGSFPDFAGEAYSVPSDLLAGFMARTSVCLSVCLSVTVLGWV